MKYAQPLKVHWLIILIALVTILFNGCGAKAPSSETQQGKLVLLNKIEPREVDGKTEVLIEGTEPILQYTSFQLTEPLRLVVDISDADSSQLPAKFSVNSGAVIDITPSQKDNIARLEFALSQAVETKVYQSGGKLVVELEKPGGEEKPEEAAPVPQEETPKPEVSTEPVRGAATVVTAVKAYAGKEGVKVVITGNGTMQSNAFMVAGKKLVIDIPGVSSKVKPRVIPVRKGGLDRVRVGQHGAPDQKVRVVLDLKKPLEYTVTPEGDTLIIAMGPALAAKPEEKVPQEPEKAPVVEKAAIPEPQPPLEAAPVVKPEKAEVEPEVNLASECNKFKKIKMNLDFQDADLINVVRLFADLAKINMILAPDVKGRVTVRMEQIPMGQAMDIILKMNGLGYVCEGNVLRIAYVSALTKEAEDESKSKEAKNKSEDLVTRIIPINYAKAGEVEPTIKKSLSSRGETVTDSRTNTLIVKDLARNVDDVVSLIKLLDKPIPQIMIEARIVEASTNFSRDIGIQWGGTQKLDAAHGNPIGATFPNSMTMTGGPTMGQTASGSGNYFVNLPAAAGAGSGGAVGFTFGSISKSLNLDLVLSALESTGEGKIVSQPRVSALDNKEARITQGTSIPYPVTSASGANTVFVEANLSLTVTPHATPDNKIFMKIQATKNAPGSILGSSGQPSIDKNEAMTEILLADGETAVIGGILSMQKSANYVKVPFFGDLPLIGWFFKKKTNSESKKEMLIFITPRLIKQDVI